MFKEREIFYLDNQKEKYKLMNSLFPRFTNHLL